MNLIVLHSNYDTESFYIDNILDILDYYTTYLQYLYSSVLKVQDGLFCFFRNEKPLYIPSTI